MPQSFLTQPISSDVLTVPERQLQLYSATKPDREPVKILVIGSQPAVNTVIHLIRQHRFAEVFEWTQFLPTDRPIQLKDGEAMKALIKYLPRP